MKEEKKKTYPCQKEQDEINALMREYSLLKSEPGNKAKCRSLKNQVAVKMWTPNFRNFLINTAKGYFHGLGTYADCEDAISDTIYKQKKDKQTGNEKTVDLFDEYSGSKNNKFTAFFLYRLRLTVLDKISDDFDDTNPYAKYKREINELLLKYSELKHNYQYSDELDSMRTKIYEKIKKDRFRKMLKEEVKSILFQCGADKDTCNKVVRKGSLCDINVIKIADIIEEYNSDKNDYFIDFLSTKLRFWILAKLNEAEDYEELVKSLANDNENGNYVRKEAPDDRTENSGRYIKREQSADTPRDSEDKPVSTPVIDPTSTPDKQTFDRMTLEEFYIKLLACKVRISRSIYYRAYATEHYILLCKNHLNRILDVNENEAFTIMDVRFADATLREKCRSFRAIENAHFKTFKEFGLDGDYDLFVPFEPKVYVKYFGCDNSRITQTRDVFNEFLDISVIKRSYNRANVEE